MIKICYLGFLILENSTKENKLKARKHSIARKEIVDFKFPPEVTVWVWKVFLFFALICVYVSRTIHSRIKQRIQIWCFETDDNIGTIIRL